MTKPTFSVTKNGTPLDPQLYTWDEKTKTFSTTENGLVLDFRNMGGCTFKTSSGCTFDTGDDCTFKTSSGCTFDTGSGCTFQTGAGCTFDTGSYCTFQTGAGCTFDTGSYCTFNTGAGCTFKTGDDCTFKTSSGCVIVRRDEFQVIQPAVGETIKLCPYCIPGYISKREDEDAFYKEIDGKRVEHVIIDGILSEVVKKRANVLHVKNYGEENISYIVKDGEKYSHGATLKEARENLIYKLSNRDKSKYESFTPETELTLAEAIEMYRVITGACEPGTRYFVDNILPPERKADKKKYTVKEVIELTRGQYNHHELVEFLG